MADSPKWPHDACVSSMQQMVHLLDIHGDRLSAILEEGTKEKLVSDLNALLGDGMGVSVAQRQARNATGDQDKVLDEATVQISSWLDAIRHAFPRDKQMQKSWGIGTRVVATSVKSVGKMMKTLVDTAERRPEEAREASIRPEHVAKMKATLEALLAADAAQAAKKVDSKQAVQLRKTTQARAERLMEKIVAAATMAFMGMPEAKEFKALLPRAPKGKKTAQTSDPEPAKS